MRHFRVVMVERRNGKTTKIEQHAYCESRQQVIEFYGLDEPDIESYEITEE